VRIASLRAQFRIAGRENLRARSRSALVISIVTLQVALVSVGAVVTRSSSENLGGLILFAGLVSLESTLVLSAAFAVGARHQLRTLGLLRAAGADIPAVMRTVLLGAAMLGAIGALAGVAIGVGLGAAMWPSLESALGRSAPSLAVVPGDLAMAMALGVFSAVIAALVPARWAAGASVGDALTGRPQTKRAPLSTGRTGLAAALVGTLVTVLGAALPGANMLLIFAGTILVVGGVAAACPAFIGAIASLAPRMPVTVRVALRDLSRNRMETGPAVAAIMASLALTIAVATFLMSAEAHDAYRSVPYCGANQVVVIPPTQEAQPAGGIAEGIARSLPGATCIEIIRAARADGTELRAGRPPIGVQKGCDSSVAVGGSALIDALGGKAPRHDTTPTDPETVVVYGNKAWGVGPMTLDLVGSDGTAEEILVTVVDAGIPLSQGLPSLVMTPEDANRWSLSLSTGWLVNTPAALTPGELRAASKTAASSGTGVLATGDNGPSTSLAGTRILVLSIGSITALAVLSVAVSLSVAETRRSWSTMREVGMPPAMRKRLAAVQAFVTTALGSALAVPAGLLPTLAIIVGRGAYPVVIPWQTLGIVTVGLPLFAALGALTLTRGSSGVSRSHTSWTQRPQSAPCAP